MRTYAPGGTLTFLIQSPHHQPTLPAVVSSGTRQYPYLEKGLSQRQPLFHPRIWQIARPAGALRTADITKPSPTATARSNGHGSDSLTKRKPGKHHLPSRVSLCLKLSLLLSECPRPVISDSRPAPPGSRGPKGSGWTSPARGRGW